MSTKTAEGGAKEAVTDKKDEKDAESEKDPSCPFSDEEIKRIEALLDKQFEREKEEAEIDGQITCLWSGRSVCFCKCGPHLCCPEHNLNCMFGGFDSGPNVPRGVDPLLKRWILWRWKDFD